MVGHIRERVFVAPVDIGGTLLVDVQPFGCFICLWPALGRAWRENWSINRVIRLSIYLQMAARGGDKLSDKDLIRVANQISPENMLVIALEYLEFQKNEIDVSKANAKAKDNPTQEFHFDLLAKWETQKGHRRHEKKSL